MVALLLIACAPVEAVDSPQLLGTIVARDTPAEVWDSAAYFYAEDESMFLYMANAEDATCEETAALLNGELGGSDTEGPEAFQPANSCTLILSSGDWDGSLAVELAEGDVTAEVVVSLNCWLDGAWAVNDEGWTFEGDYWNGSPTAFDLEVSGDSDGGTYTVEMENYRGHDPYDFSGTDYPGTGLVSGTGNVEWCPELENTPIFP